MNKSSRFMQRLLGFARATGGLAALEFAIMMPVMLILLFGSIDLLDMLHANRRTQNTAASLSDVIARDTEVSNAEIAGLWAATEVLMYPNNGADVQVRVTSIRIVNSSRAEVVWSEGRGMTALNPGFVITTLPPQMMQPGSSVIWTETLFPYQSPIGFLTSGSVNLRHNAYRRSRLVDPIPRVS
jgi:Flp pilus assembly protein TadG